LKPFLVAGSKLSASHYEVKCEHALNVLWTERSIEDLLAIKHFISQDSVVRAEEWIQELYSTGIGLANFPTRGRIVPEFNQENLRELLIDNYRMVYRIKKKRG
jgi:toxin ParE1/3/4